MRVYEKAAVFIIKTAVMAFGEQSYGRNVRLFKRSGKPLRVEIVAYAFYQFGSMKVEMHRTVVARYSRMG